MNDADRMELETKLRHRHTYEKKRQFLAKKLQQLLEGEHEIKDWFEIADMVLKSQVSFSDFIQKLHGKSFKEQARRQIEYQEPKSSRVVLKAKKR